MAQPSWRDDFERIVPGRAQAYSRRGTAWGLEMPFENVVGPGGMLTTVGDWLKWNDALDQRTLGGWLVDSLESQATLTNGRKISYAMGLTVNDWRGQREVSHSGSTGGYSTYLMRVPAHGVSVAVLCNASGSNATSFARQMAEALVPNLTTAAAPDTVALDAAAASRIAGVYRSERTYEPVFIGVPGPAGGRGGPQLRSLRDGGLLVGNIRVIPQLGRDGKPVALRQVLANGDTIGFKYVGASGWTPAAHELNAFAGQYASNEIKATWTVRVDSGRVVLSSRRGTRQALTPVYRDAFTAGSMGTVWFSRNPAGEVTAMHISSARLWNLAIPKVGSGA
jgi:hypothetical protein